MRRALLVSAVIIGLLFCPGASRAGNASKAQTISALEAQDILTSDRKNTFLVDVRSRAEYTLLGHPPQAYNVPWRFLTTDFQVKDGPYQGGKAPFTGYQLAAKPNPDFVGVIQSLFKPDDRIIIISNQGDEGAQAADTLVEAGFRKVYNIRHGFWGEELVPRENDKLAERYSPKYGLPGHVNGWVYWGLPVSHHSDPRFIYPPDLKRMQTR
ncbi:MAG: hypothetical protein KQJ78_01720 [Deltaproteobacteria bacterium]|nr:hypothetical protein [Deltaproteobacteria bacterium]